MTTSTVTMGRSTFSVSAALDRAAQAAVEIPAVAEAGPERVLSYPFARLLDLSLSEHEAPVQVSQPGFEARRHADHPKLE